MITMLKIGPREATESVIMKLLQSGVQQVHDHE